MNKNNKENRQDSNRKHNREQVEQDVQMDMEKSEQENQKNKKNKKHTYRKMELCCLFSNRMFQFAWCDQHRIPQWGIHHYMSGTFLPQSQSSLCKGTLSMSNGFVRLRCSIQQLSRDRKTTLVKKMIQFVPQKRTIKRPRTQCAKCPCIRILN